MRNTKENKRKTSLFTLWYTLFLMISLVLIAIYPRNSEASVTFSKPLDNTLCYAQAAYYEARGQGATAMRLVQEVTYNRVMDSRWPRSACGVVWQASQYSWTNNSHIGLPDAKAKIDIEALTKARQMAAELRAGKWKPTISANHFLAPEALTGRFPSWAACSDELRDLGKCVSYYRSQDSKMKYPEAVRVPDFIYAGIWFYTL